MLIVANGTSCTGLPLPACGTRATTAVAHATAGTRSAERTAAAENRSPRRTATTASAIETARATSAAPAIVSARAPWMRAY